MLLALGLLCTGLASGQPTTTPPKPTWIYAHDLRVRKPDVKDFDKDTPKIGVEFFKDEGSGGVIAVSQSGSIAVVPTYTPGTDKKAAWLFAHDLRARTSDEDKFTKDTPKFGVEVFKDGPSGKLLYVTNKATVALADAPASLKTDQDPVWHHALILKVRGPAEASFGKDTKKFGVEAFKDGNTGGLVYVSDAGFITTAPAPDKAPDPDLVKAPKALHGLALRVRKAGEADFGKDTKKIGVEVFRDENTGGLIYISETGSIAAVPAPATVKTGQGVTWKQALELKARPGGEADFAKANKYGIEVLQDNNTGYLVLVADTGAIAVLPKK